ncbi:MAG: hypothetical protein E7403_02185 [Ruminococcaceae bacterium]|nr:hypothetical protein [Oscillospiraceae bacterium]
MKYLTQKHFYYGAILSAIIEYNPDASLVLLEQKEDSRKVYHIQTSTAKQECVIFFKHAFEKKIKPNSWLFEFSPEDKAELKDYEDRQIPTFIYLLCATDELRGSQIAVLKYRDEFERVLDKKAFTVSTKKNFPDFYLHKSKRADDVVRIPRNRIEKTFDDLISEVVRESGGYYCPNCGHNIVLK